LFNARGKKLLPPAAVATGMVSIAVQTSGPSSAASSNNNLKRRSQAASGVGGFMKKSLHDPQQQNLKSRSEIVLLRRDQSLHSLAASQAADLAEEKLPKSGAFFKKLFQR
jgi:hypothetical protein